MDFTVVIPFWNGHQYLDKLLSTIPEAIPVLIVDDRSDKPVGEISRLNTEVMRLLDKGYFTGAANAGMERCKSDVLILNQDTYFSNDKWLNFITDKKTEYGLFGESAGKHPAWPNRYIHGTFMYIRRDVIDTVGLMDAENYPLWGSTCEYQLRACRKGFKALPAQEIPGFVHERRGNYGSAIKAALRTVQNRGQLIRTPPFTSVIITCYNYGRYLQDAVNSLIGGKTSLGEMPGQTRQDFEIIIVDDGSTDDSAKIAEKLADPWKGIHFTQQKNKGSAAAMNTGIQFSHARKGTLIAPLDADDMFEPQRLETMTRMWGNNPHSVIYDNMIYFANGKRSIVINWQTGKTKKYVDLGTYDFEDLLHKNRMHKGLLYPKQAWIEAGGYPEIMTRGREDWAFNVALGIKGWCGVNTREFHYLYRREAQNRTLTNTTPKHHSAFLGQIKSLFPNIYEGERSEMCCGRPSAQAAAKNNGVASMSVRYSKDLPGQNGMAILEYTGGNAGDTNWVGPATGTTYIFGGVRKKGYVDKRDVPGMLAMRRMGRQLFVELEPVV